MDSILEKINKSALKFLVPLSSEKTFAVIVKEAMKLVDAEYGSIFLEEDGTLERRYASDPMLYDIKIQPNGFVYQSFREDKAFALGVDKIPYFNRTILALGLKSIVIIPLSYRKRAIGVLTVLSKERTKFKGKELQILKLFGALATLAIRKAELYFETKQALKDRNTYRNLEMILEKINRASLKLLMPLTPQETYKTIVSEAIKLGDAEYGSLTLAQHDSFKEAYSTLPIRVKRRKRGYTYQAFKSNKVLVIHPDESEEFKKAHPEFVPLGIKSNVNIPLSYRKRAVGVLIINLKKKRSFTKREKNIFLLFGSFASLAIRKSQLYNQTKQAVEIRDLFITMAAHELRTPLTTIIGYAQLLQNKLHKENSSAMSWTNELLWEGQRLTKLVNELLEVNRIKSGRFQFVWQECNLYDVLNRAINSFRVSHPSRNIIFNNGIDAEHNKIIGDENKLFQVFTSLIENAIKFSPQDKDVIVSLKRNGSYLVTGISDSGIGISKKHIPHIFKDFYSPNKEKEEGMGFGLFLAKNIIRQHHGAIAILSKEGKGTTLSVKLPIAKL